MFNSLVNRIAGKRIDEEVNKRLALKESQFEQTRRDAEQVSNYLKGCIGVAYGTNLDYLKRATGLDAERLMEAMAMLKKRGYVSWGGGWNDSISFVKGKLPKTL